MGITLANRIPAGSERKTKTQTALIDTRDAFFFSQFAWSRGNGNGAHLMRHLIEALNFNVLDKAAGYIGVFEIVPGTGGGSCIDLYFNPSNTAISFTLHICLISVAAVSEISFQIRVTGDGSVFLRTVHISSLYIFCWYM